MDSLLLGLSFKYKSFKNEFLKNNKHFKVILIPYLLLLIFLGYQLFSRRSNINFFGYTLSIIFFVLYLLAIYALIKMILVEFGIIKKNKLHSKFLNSSRQQFELSEKKYFKPNDTTKLQDEVVILNKKTSNNNESIKSVKDDLIKANKNHTDFIKNEFEPTRNLLNKTTKRTNIIEEQIFPKEKIKIYCSQKDIKSIFMEYKKDLFENLDVHNFMKYMFEGSNKLGASNLYDDEKNNILAIMTLLIEKEKIDGNNSLLYKLTKPYLKFNIKLRMFGINIKKRKYSLTNDITESHILKKITNFKNI